MSHSREHPSVHQGVKTKVKSCSIRVILGAFALVLIAFYAGFMLGLHQCQQCLHGSTTVQNSIEQAKVDILQAVSQQSVKEKVVVIQPQEADEPLKEELVMQMNDTRIRHDDESGLFPESIHKLVAGMARVDRDLFATKFDIGVPLNPTTPGNKDVLILYNSENALPDQYEKYREDVPHLNVKSATKHCHTMKVVLTEPNQQKQCLAIMGQWESYHVHRFARFPPKMNGPVDEKHPLKYVSRVPGENGKVIERSRSFDTKMWDKLLVEYLTNLDPTLQQLKPVAARAAKNNTVVVMVCNLGQSELLMNFACSAKSRGLDLSQVLVFATDAETKTLAEGLGLNAFYDELNFESIPEQAAQTYADRTFSKMMLAKVYCVHMINALGYDLLFQDVDIVWYRNPVEYFTDDSNPHRDFDMYFQQDGSPSRRYAPYSPNTGFYFVRNNLKTQYFFHSLLMQGNLVTGSGSHQSALNIVLQEHVSWRGLRVKVLNVETEMFPGGFHFHRRKEFMKDMIAGKVEPYIFHMSWTTNKDNKRMFFEQLGDWHVNDQCIGKTASKILSDGQNNGSDLPNACCLAKPQAKCHYRDKPSRMPCKDRPSIDKDKASWW